MKNKVKKENISQEDENIEVVQSCECDDCQ